MAKHKDHYPERFLLENITSLDDFPKIKGLDLSKPISISSLIQSFTTTGFQASKLSQATSIIKTMRREKAKIFLSFTSNMISSGIREIITYLVKEKIIDVIITPAGGIEEDIIKALKPFALGEFNTKGEWLFEHGINRTGNIFVPNDRYLYFEKFLNPILDNLYKDQKKNKRPSSAQELCYAMGSAIKNEESFLYWAEKNNIPVFCPALTDGSIGDLLYFMKQRHKDFYIDITQDMYDIVNEGLKANKTGLIILGGGIAKHHTLNAQIFREGCDYVVYINTGNEFDGSDSGANVDEAVSWGKVKSKALSVKVHGDATIIFPIVMAGVLKK